MGQTPAVGTLRIFSWNVAGIAKGVVDDFINIFDREHTWDVLLLQEFTGAKDVIPSHTFWTADEHVVFVTPPCLGCRSTAIVVHREIKHGVLQDTYRFTNRASSILLQWEGHNINMVTAHLQPTSGNTEAFNNSLEDLEAMLDTQEAKSLFKKYGLHTVQLNQQKHLTILGVDAQADLGPLDDFDDVNIVGPYGFGERTLRAGWFIEVCTRFRLTIHNSFTNEPAGNWTCSHWGNAEPSQLDYICSDVPPKYRPQVRLTDSTATPSDHVVLAYTLVGKYNRIWNAYQRKQVRLPLRWAPKDDNTLFNSHIRELLSLPEEKTIAGDAYQIFTDGSYHAAVKRRQKRGFAGWGFVVYDSGKEITFENEVTSFFGPVVIFSTNQGYLGATKMSNNTAELSAIIEAMIWTFQRPSSKYRFFSDSSYVVRLLKGDFVPQENVALALLAVHWWSLLEQKHEVGISWVRGHSGNKGNERADKLAGRGCWEDNAGEFYIRPKLDFYWKQDVYAASLKHHNQGSQSILGARAVRRKPGTTTVHTNFQDYRILDDKPIATIADVTKSITEAAKIGGKNTPKRWDLNLDPKDPLILEEKELTRRRNGLPHGVERKDLSIKLCKLRRQIKVQRIHLRSQKAVEDRRSPLCANKRVSIHALHDFRNTEQLIDDPGDILDNANAFLGQLFGENKPSDLPDWVWRHFDLETLEQVPGFDGRTLRALIMTMAGGKVCADDGLVAEMLKHLDIDILHLIADVFKLRILNHSSEDDEQAWDQVLLNLIQKKVNPITIKDFRPIAILPVLLKLYAKLLDYLTGNNLGTTVGVQFAFKSGHQCHEPVFILRRLIEVSLEWATPIFVLDGDIAKAYDYTRHTRILDALLQKDIPALLAAAIIRETTRARCRIKIGNLESQYLIGRSRSLWQGDPLAPKLFNATLDVLVQEFEATAKRHKWGWHLHDPDGGPRQVCLLLFADNYWIITTSINELNAANKCWQELLQSAGWFTPVTDLCYATTAEDDQYTNAQVLHQDQVVERRAKLVGFKMLGTQLTFGSHYDTELERRFRAAWCAFHKHSDILCCKAAPLAGRLKFLLMVVSPALFWCAGSWNLRVQKFVALRGLQRNMIRKMIGLKKYETEDLETYMRRAETAVTAAMHRHRILSWDIYARRVIFRWAGWVARLQTFDKHRLTLAVLHHKNLKWLQLIKDNNGGRELHGRYLRVWRWETVVHNFFAENAPGEHWEKIALDDSRWSAFVDMVG